MDRLAAYLPVLRTAGLLFISNCFMITAWYGHLRFKNITILTAIGVSWLLALPEYAFQVPANRLGYQSHLSAFQLKIMQECITLVVFIIFARLVLGESMQLKHGIAFGLILAAVAVVFV